MIKNLLALFFAVIISFGAQAQKDLRYWEAGGYAGSLNYSGELTQGGDFGSVISETRFQFGLFLKRNVTPKFNFGAEIGYGKLYAADENHGMADRGFVMNTSLIMTNFTLDYNFKKFGKYYRRNSNTPFITFGLGFMSFQPTYKTDVDFTDYILLKDSEENSNYTSNIKLGFGWKWMTGKSGIINLSFNYHISGTPFLEGFIEKGQASGNDKFYGIRFAYSVGFFET